MSRRIVSAATIVLLAAVSTISSAQPAAANFPTHPVRLIVPFAPGGSTDQLARPIAAKLQDLWRQPVVVENRGGAGTVIGTDAVAKAAADGYTIGMIVAGHTINPSIKASLPYDTAKDLVGITQLTRQQMVWVAHPSAPFNTVEELIAHAKRKPDTVTYGSSGHGVATHLTGELLANKAGIKLVHVAYKGAAPALTDLLAGQIQLMCDLPSTAIPHVASGRLKVIALTGASRQSEYKQYPVIAETIPGFEVSSMFGMIAPSGTPPAVLRKIRDDIVTVLNMPDMAKMIRDGGMQAVGSTPEEFNAYIRDEIAKWAAVIRDNKIAVQ